MTRAIVSLAVGLACACGLDDELKGQPCGSNEDCTPHSQACVRTDAERAADLPGICARAGSGCEVGRQLGCECDPMDLQASCLQAAVPVGTDYPAMVCDPTTQVCVIDSGDTDGGT